MDAHAPIRLQGPRISEPPSTTAERYALERECLKQAKRYRRGNAAKTLAAQFYNEAVDECQRRIREPATQQTVVQEAPPAIPAPPPPRGMEQRASGLYVPKEMA